MRKIFYSVFNTVRHLPNNTITVSCRTKIFEPYYHIAFAKCQQVYEKNCVLREKYQNLRPWCRGVSPYTHTTSSNTAEGTNFLKMTNQKKIRRKIYPCMSLYVEDKLCVYTNCI